MHLQASHAPRVTPPIAHATCRNPDHIKDCVFRHNSHPCKTEASTTDMLCPHTASAMNHLLWPRQVLLAPSAEVPSEKNSNIRHFDQTENQEFKFGIPPKPQYDQNAAHTAVRVPASDPSSDAAPSAHFTARPSRQQTRATPAPTCSPPPRALPRPP